VECVRCFEKIPENRAEFLKKEGRPPICLPCQQELEESGEYETYVAEFSCIEKEGEGYAFMPVRVEEKRLKENYPDYISITRKSKENQMQENGRF